jgi:hypothetical protein
LCAEKEISNEKEAQKTEGRITVAMQLSIEVARRSAPSLLIKGLEKCVMHLSMT